MPTRNLIVIFVAAVVSLACYQRAARYSGTLASAMKTIEDSYVDKVDPRILFEGAMQGMMSKLDPNSSYTSPKEYKQLSEQLEGDFGGIGIMVEVDPESKNLTVMGVLPNTPAQKAGILSGDTIISIDGQDARGLTIDKSIERMRGPEGSAIKVEVQHADATTSSYEMVRARIVVDSVLGDLRRPDGDWDFRLEEDPRIGYIRIVTFGQQTSLELEKALESLEQSPAIKGLILDLRGNAGGLLDAAHEVADMFIDQGMVVSTRGREGHMRREYVAEAGVLLPREVPVVVLVDRFSASASEIVAACLQDYHRAVICGQRSWGKGTVQEVIRLEGGNSAMRLTTATYWRPSGKDIHKRRDAKDEDDWGVRPDEGMEIALTDEELEKVMKDRRKRDLSGLRTDGKATKPKIEAAAPEKPPKPAPVDPSADLPPTKEAETETPFSDPQMRKAIDYLKSKMA